MKTTNRHLALAATVAMGATAASASTVQTTSVAETSPATYANPSGAMEKMPSTSASFVTSAQANVTIAFSARGSVKPSGSQVVPIVFVACKIDGKACRPGQTEFLYPQFCCDSRSFQWAVQGLVAGTHTVDIFWGMGNPTSATVTARTLTVETVSP